MLVHVILSGRVVSVRAVADEKSEREAKLEALRAAVAAGEVTASEALQVTFDVSQQRAGDRQAY